MSPNSFPVLVKNKINEDKDMTATISKICLGNLFKIPRFLIAYCNFLIFT